MYRTRFYFWLLAPGLVLLGTKGAQGQRVTALIDARKTGDPIPKISYGGFMEPATTQVWAEMLSDRAVAGRQLRFRV